MVESSELRDLRAENRRLRDAIAAMGARHRATYQGTMDVTPDTPGIVHFRAERNDEVRMLLWSRRVPRFIAAAAAAVHDYVRVLRVELNGTDVSAALAARKEPLEPTELTGEFVTKAVALDDLPVETGARLCGWNALALVAGTGSAGRIEYILEVNPVG